MNKITQLPLKNITAFLACILLCCSPLWAQDNLLEDTIDGGKQSVLTVLEFLVWLTRPLALIMLVGFLVLAAKGESDKMKPYMTTIIIALIVIGAIEIIYQSISI